MNMNIIFMIGELPAPLIMMAVGFMMCKKPPRFGESVGYRTKSSLRTEQTWDFAQTTYGKLAGIVFAFLSGATLLLNICAIIRNFDDTTGIIIFLVQNSVVVIALISIVRVVERKLGTFFDESGKYTRG